MNKIAEYIQQHIKGEVSTALGPREYFATDGSVFELMPKMVAYPQNEADVRKILRFSWQLAEKGKLLPITARGKGTDQAGAALGDGLMMVFPAHMNKVISIDKDNVTVQPGEIYGSLQKILHTHGQYLPPYPSSIAYSTVGGAVANNAAGENTIKYGSTRNYVKRLQVVLANGELIETGRLTRKQLSKKMGGTTFESEIYRQLDGLIMDNWQTIQTSRLNVSKNSAGYDLADVKRKDGSFDLTPLIVGSQGTLGLVTEITFKTEPLNRHTALICGYFDDIDEADKAVKELMRLNPSALEFVDENLLRLVHKENAQRLAQVIQEPYPKIVLLIEFDDVSERIRKSKLKKTKKILATRAYEYSVARNRHEQEILWSIRRSAAAVMWHNEGKLKALPIIEDGIVPTDKFVPFIHYVYELFKKHNLELAVWGHAGNGNLHMQPFLDLSSTSDRQKMFKVMDEYYEKVISMGGSTSGEHNDGRLRAPYLESLFGTEMYQLLVKTKEIFDPYKILNPGVKIGVTRKDQVELLRKSYSMDHLSDHMPRL